MPTTSTETQGQRLRALRLRCRYTQDYVAAQLGTTKQTVYKYECDLIRNIPLARLVRLAGLYGCSVAYLQGLADEPGLPPAVFQPVEAPCGVPRPGCSVRAGMPATEHDCTTPPPPNAEAIAGLFSAHSASLPHAPSSAHPAIARERDGTTTPAAPNALPGPEVPASSPLPLNANPASSPAPAAIPFSDPSAAPFDFATVQELSALYARLSPAARQSLLQFARFLAAQEQP